MRRIFDPVHGFILLNDLESALIDTVPFQRLRYIRQLGSAYLVYPGATHTRFEHSLGTMELASRIFDHMIVSEDSSSWLPEATYAKQIVRLAALCHDLGHLPFSHTAEKLVLGAEGHERWTVMMIKSPIFKELWERVGAKFPKQDVVEDLVKLAVGESKLQQLGVSFTFSKWHQALGQIIAGDFFGADRIDYLLRDARYTGVSYGMFDYHQLIEMVRILPSHHSSRLEMGVEESGIEACEALLVARHFMHRRVYQYGSVKSLAFHLARYIAEVLGPHFEQASLETYLQWSDNEILSLLRSAQNQVDAVGREEALCLMHRSKRFRAFSIHSVDKELLISIASELPKGAISWEMGSLNEEQEKEFPVLRRHGEVVSSKKLLHMHIPKHRSTWVYVAPEFASMVEGKLSQYM